LIIHNNFYTASNLRDIFHNKIFDLNTLAVNVSRNLAEITPFWNFSEYSIT